VHRDHPERRPAELELRARKIHQHPLSGDSIAIHIPQPHSESHVLPGPARVRGRSAVRGETTGFVC
jgi:hypothetical protein